MDVFVFLLNVFGNCISVNIYFYMYKISMHIIEYLILWYWTLFVLSFFVNTDTIVNLNIYMHISRWFSGFSTGPITLNVIFWSVAVLQLAQLDATCARSNGLSSGADGMACTDAVLWNQTLFLSVNGSTCLVHTYTHRYIYIYIYIYTQYIYMHTQTHRHTDIYSFIIFLLVVDSDLS